MGSDCYKIAQYAQGRSRALMFEYRLYWKHDVLSKVRENNITSKKRLKPFPEFVVRELQSCKNEKS